MVSLCHVVAAMLFQIIVVCTLLLTCSSCALGSFLDPGAVAPRHGRKLTQAPNRTEDPIEDNFEIMKTSRLLHPDHYENLLEETYRKLGRGYFPVWDISVSPSGKTIYYLQEYQWYDDNNISTLPNASQWVSVMKKVDITGGASSSNYKITQVLGPWFNSPRSAGDLYTRSLGLDVDWTANGTKILLTDEKNNVVRSFTLTNADSQLDLSSQSSPFVSSSSDQGRSLPRLRYPIKIARDPITNVLYVSSKAAIYRLNLTFNGTTMTDWDTSNTNWTVLAGVDIWRSDDAEGAKQGILTFNDSDVPSQARFNRPFLSSHAISSDGRLLYFADNRNHRIRQVDTATGATDTIAGGVVEGDDDGPALSARFKGPCGVALTSDGCALFVTDWTGRLRILTFQSPGGKGDVVSTLAQITAVGTQEPDDNKLVGLALSPQEDFIYVGTFNGKIYQLKIDGASLPRWKGLRCVSKDSSSKSALPLILGLTFGFVCLLAAACIMVACYFAKKNRKNKDVKIESSPASGARVLERARHGAGGTGPDSDLPSSIAVSNSTSELPIAPTPHGGHELVVSPSSASASLVHFSTERLADACSGFHASNLIGRGGAGEVYKGVLEHGQTVAIKVMKSGMSNSKFRQFEAEMNVLKNVRHVNLCELMGFSADRNDKWMLVFPYVSGGSLFDRLHVGDGSSEGATVEPSSKMLDWVTRVSIAKQIACGLNYLHNLVDPPVVHRDVKSANVLLEGHKKIRAYVTDFGLAKIGQSQFSEDEVMMSALETYHVSGTFGYMAPEYLISGRLTAKNDVYAFGVVLLELITGRKAFLRSVSGTDDQSETLVAWATRKCQLGEVSTTLSEELMSQIIDRRLKIDKWEWNSVCMLANVAMDCVHSDPNTRITIKQAFERIDTIWSSITTAMPSLLREDEKVASGSFEEPSQTWNEEHSTGSPSVIDKTEDWASSDGLRL